MLDANTNRDFISCPKDISIWRPIAAHHAIYTQELSALKQVELDNYTFRVLFDICSGPVGLYLSNGALSLTSGGFRFHGRLPFLEA